MSRGEVGASHGREGASVQPVRSLEAHVHLFQLAHRLAGGAHVPHALGKRVFELLTNPLVFDCELINFHLYSQYGRRSMPPDGVESLKELSVAFAD